MDHPPGFGSRPITAVWPSSGTYSKLTGMVDRSITISPSPDSGASMFHPSSRSVITSVRPADALTRSSANRAVPPRQPVSMPQSALALSA